MHNIKTSFNLEEPEQTALFGAAKRLVEEGLAAARVKGEDLHKALKPLLAQAAGAR